MKKAQFSIGKTYIEWNLDWDPKTYLCAGIKDVVSLGVYGGTGLQLFVGKTPKGVAF